MARKRVSDATRKTTPRLIKAADIYFACDEAQERGANFERWDRKLLVADLAFPRHLTRWQVACLRWWMPSAALTFAYPDAEIQAVPRARRAQVTARQEAIMFQKAHLHAAYAVIGLDPDRHSRLVETVRPKSHLAFVEAISRMGAPPDRPCDERCIWCAQCAHWLLGQWNNGGWPENLK